MLKKKSSKKRPSKKVIRFPKASEFIDTQLKEELKDIEPNDPTVDSIKAEVKELRNILYKVLAHGPGSGEVEVLKMDDVDTDDLWRW